MACTKQARTARAQDRDFFSDSAENVWVDNRGRLHLRITYREGRWWCAEDDRDNTSLGLGTYTYRLVGDVSSLDPQAVLGLFTWDDSAASPGTDPQNAEAYWHSEIDVEISRWGQPDNRNAQFVVQPYTTPENIDRFELPPSPASEHQFTWRTDSVSFASRDAGGKVVHSFTRALSPLPAQAMPRINLWLLGGQPPQRGADVQVVIERVDFASETPKIP